MRGIYYAKIELLRGAIGQEKVGLLIRGDWLLAVSFCIVHIYILSNALGFFFPFVRSSALKPVNKCYFELRGFGWIIGSDGRTMTD